VLEFVETLIFYDNSLSSSIPDGIGGMRSLLLLDLESNALTGEFFAGGILNLTNLLALRASFNDLNGTIPETIDTLSNLQQLWIAENEFSGGLPTQFGNLQGLGTALRLIIHACLVCFHVILICVLYLLSLQIRCFFTTIPLTEQSCLNLDC